MEGSAVCDVFDYNFHFEVSESEWCRSLPIPNVQKKSKNQNSAMNSRSLTLFHLLAIRYCVLRSMLSFVLSFCSIQATGCTIYYS